MEERNEYELYTLVWEMTMGCNLRCKHCGSSCQNILEDELSVEEAWEVCKQIVDIKPEWISLSGGEPLLRKDWAEITEYLKSNGIGVRMITNGTLITETVANKMKQSGLDLVSLSIDGPQEIHDAIRGKGIFQKVLNSLKLLREAEMQIGVNTTVIKDNIDYLEEMYEIFVEQGVKSWQIQPGIPEGNLAEHRDAVLNIEDIQRIVDFSYSKNLEGKINIFLAETIGYYSKQEIMSRMLAKKTNKPIVFSGCNAGIRSLGILHNGDVVGCTSIRKRGFVEGNLRTRTLSEIWNDPEAFAWRRKMQVSDLGEKCSQCKYVKYCLGGCTNVRLIFNNDIKSDNPLCLYAACNG